MPSLRDILLQPNKRAAVVADCAQLVDDEVAHKGGLGGLVVKGAYGLVKALKPGIICDAVDHLLDEFVGALEGPWAASVQAGGDVVAYFNARPAEIADALLGITDQRAARSENATLKKAYEKLRPQGKKHVEAAVPGIARVLQKHAVR